MNGIPATYRNVSLIISTVCILFVAGCGYKNPYAGPNGDRTISLSASMWENQTSELGLESVLFNSLNNWLQKSRQIHLASTPAEADYQLSGKILSVSHPGLSYGDFDRVKELQAMLTVEFAFKEAETGKILWQETKNIQEEPYVIGADAVRTQGNKKDAFEKIAEDLAEEVYLRVLNFMKNSYKD